MSTLLVDIQVFQKRGLEFGKTDSDSSQSTGIPIVGHSFSMSILPLGALWLGRLEVGLVFVYSEVLWSDS